MSHPHFYYSDQQIIIAEIYKRAGTKSFAFQAITIPYWVQEGWIYLFWYEGTCLYHKLPITKNNPNELFAIVEDNPRKQSLSAELSTKKVTTWGKKEIDRFTMRDITVIVRQVK